jgi:spore germination protein KC
MRLKSIVLILITVSFIFLCGCWDYREYESLAMVSVLGFDTDGTTSQVTVTARYLVKDGGSSSQATGGSAKATTGSTAVKATGLSIDDACTKIQQATGKNLFYGYMDEIVIGENAAKQITADIIGYINRTPNIRMSAYLTVTSGKAEEVLSTYDPNNSDPTGKTIHNLIDQSINSGSAFPVTIQSFEESLVINGEEPVAPVITVEQMAQSKNSGTSSANSFENSGDSVETGAVELGEQKEGYDKINSIAAFQNGELAGWLEGRECTGLGWICNQKLNVLESVKTSSENNVMNTFVFRVTNSNCDIKTKLDDGKPVIYINAYVEADLRKFSNNINADFLTPDVISLLEKGLADNVRTDIKAAVQKGQKELKTDIFRIGFNFYRQYPKLWHTQYEKSWNQIFPTLQINVNVDAKVIDTGTSIRKFPVK